MKKFVKVCLLKGAKDSPAENLASQHWANIKIGALLGADADVAHRLIVAPDREPFTLLCIPTSILRFDHQKNSINFNAISGSGTAYGECGKGVFPKIDEIVFDTSSDFEMKPWIAEIIESCYRNDVLVKFMKVEWPEWT